jgi:adenosylcobinamide-GDP ribazoletransferase
MAENKPTKVVQTDYHAGWFDDFRMALAFLTRLPLSVDWGKGSLAQAFRAFPFAGMVIGALGGGVYWIGFSLGLTSLIAAFVAVMTVVLITGALHEDGLADVADGFGGGAKREDKLRIMKDSAIGTYGVLALILVVGLRIACLGEIAAPEVVFGLMISSAALSRAMMPIAMIQLNPARQDGLAVSAGQPTSQTAWVACALGVVLALLFLDPAWGFAAALAAGSGTLVMVVVARRQIGGYTGDVLGAIQQISETCIFLAVVMLS